MRVLIVDDHEPAAHSMAQLLKYLRHTAECAVGGEEALAALAGQTPDLVVLDYMMPEMDGLEVLRRVRADPRTKSLPVVMWTGAADDAFRDRARELGATEVWAKGAMQFEDYEERFRHFAAAPF